MPVYYWPAYWASVVLLAGVCRRRLSFVVVVVCNAADGRAGRPPGVWAGQYGYVPLGRHLVVTVTQV